MPCISSYHASACIPAAAVAAAAAADLNKHLLRRSSCTSRLRAAAPKDKMKDRLARLTGSNYIAMDMSDKTTHSVTCRTPPPSIIIYPSRSAGTAPHREESYFVAAALAGDAVGSDEPLAAKHLPNYLPTCGLSPSAIIPRSPTIGGVWYHGVAHPVLAPWQPRRGILQP